MGPQHRPLESFAIFFSLLILLLGSASPARAQAGLLVYVPNATTNNVSVFRTNADGTLTAVTTIAVGTNPFGTVVHADQAFAYVSNVGSDNVSVIDTKTQTVVQTIAAGDGPVGLALNPDNTRLYVANNNGGANSVTVYGVAEGSGLLTTLTTLTSGLNAPRSLAVSPDGSRLYVLNQGGNSVRVFDTSTNNALTTIAVGNQPLDIAVNPAGTRAYVTNFTGNTVSVIDTSSDTVPGAPVPTGTGPTKVLVSPDGSRYYVANSTAGTISQFDAATDTEVAAAVSTGGATIFGLGITPTGGFVYATNQQNDVIALFSVGAGGALSGLGTQAVGLGNSNPSGLGMCGKNGNILLSGGYTFVANTAAAIGCTANNPFFTGGTLLVNADALVFPQTFTVGIAGGTIATGGNTAEFAGTFSGGGQLTKEGSGTLTLSGPNSTLGALAVADGTLRVTGSLVVGSPVIVDSGATLEGTGAIFTPVTVNNAGRVSPGNPGSSTGTLATGNLTLSSGSVLAISLNSAAPGGYDAVSALGTVTLAGGTLSLSLGFTSSVGQIFTIIDNDASDGVTGTFAGLPESTLFTAGGTTFHISYRGGTGNDVVLSVLPVTPVISGFASQSAGPGGAIHDTVTLVNGASPTGTITFRAFGPDDAACSGTPAFMSERSVVQNGSYQSASFVPSSGAVYRWVASYSGDSNNNAVATACGDPNQTVTIGGGKTAQTITFGALPAQTFGDPPFAVTATSSSGLPVSFSSATPSVCTVSGNTVSLVAAGVCTIAADQAGDSTYNAAPTVTQSFAVAQAGQTIAFGPLPARTLAGSPFTVSATATSGLAVTFSSQAPGVCSVSGSSVTLLAAGTCTIAADQAGNGNYNAAPQVTRSFTVGPSCSLSPAQLPVGLERIPYSATVTLANAAGVLTLTGSLPPGLTFSNGVVSGTPTARGAFSFTVSGSDSTGCQASASYSLAISAERRLAVSAGAGGAAIVRAFNVASATPRLDVNAFPGFTGGVSVAQGDVDGNGVADVIVGAGAGGSSTVTILSGGTPGLSFNAFPAFFRGGVEVAAGDVTGDGTPEILVAASCGGPGAVRAFNGRTGTLVREYPIAPPFATCGLHLAAGDVNADGTADIVVGSGELGAPFVQVINGASGAVIRDLVSFDASFSGGVYVAAGDVTGDGFADVITGAAAGGLPRVRVFDGVTGAQIGGPLGSFLAYPFAFTGGVRVAAGDLNGDGHSEVITGAGPGGGPHVRVWDGASGTEIYGLYALDPSFSGGTFVAGPPAAGRMAIDIAAARTTGTQVRIAGWALREIAINSVGTDAIHVWALPAGGGAPVFVGAADNRVARPDVAAYAGGEFLMAGFDFTGTLAAGTYDLIVFVRNSRTLKFDQSRVVRVTVN